MSSNKTSFKVRANRSAYRVSSETSNDLEEDSNTLIWAVSYSDLLMLLTCFFIIFFNLDTTVTKKEVEKKEEEKKLVEVKIKNEEKKLIEEKISFRVKEEVAAIEAKKVETEKGHSEQMNLVLSKLKNILDNQSTKESPAAPGQPGSLGKFIDLRDIITGGPGENVKQELKENKGIVIYFRENFYKVGQFHLSNENKASLKRIIDIIAPYSSYFNLVFVGYADQSQYRKVTSETVIDSNMVLSMLRAGKAVEYSLELGLDSMWVSAQGMGENVRQTRSLGLKIIER